MNISLPSMTLLCFFVVDFTELNELSVCELNEVLMELESQIKENSEVLIAELALRDELEYEKELKNSFISHLLAVQTKRRQHNLDRKKNKNGDKNTAHAVQQSKVKHFFCNTPSINAPFAILVHGVFGPGNDLQ